MANAPLKLIQKELDRIEVKHKAKEQAIKAHKQKLKILTAQGPQLQKELKELNDERQQWLDARNKLAGGKESGIQTAIPGNEDKTIVGQPKAPDELRRVSLNDSDEDMPTTKKRPAILTMAKDGPAKKPKPTPAPRKSQMAQPRIAAVKKAPPKKVPWLTCYRCNTAFTGHNCHYACQICSTVLCERCGRDGENGEKGHICREPSREQPESTVDFVLMNPEKGIY